MNNVPDPDIYTENKCKDSWNADKQLLVPEKLMGCLKDYLAGAGGQYSGRINMNYEETKITSFTQSIKLIYIEDSANEGVELLQDMSKLTSEADLGDTFSFNQKYFDYETYVVF